MSADVCYTGDTTVAGIVRNRDLISRSKMLIMEMTFVGTFPSKERALATKHVHLDAFVEALSEYPALLKDVECIVMIHFSARYSATRIVHELKTALPTVRSQR